MSKEGGFCDIINTEMFYRQQTILNSYVVITTTIKIFKVRKSILR